MKKVRSKKRKTISPEMKKKISLQVGKDPLHRLRKEHKEGIKQVALLENAATSIKLNGFSGEAFEQIAAIIRLINIDVRSHTEKEEKFLLPLVEKYDRDLANRFRNHHREFWRVSRQLLTFIEDIEEGYVHGTAVRDMVQTALLIAQYLREHISKENSDLFPFVKKTLTPSEYEQFSNNISNT